MAFVQVLRLAGFLEETAHATITYPEFNPLEKTDRKFSGNKEKLSRFVAILEKVQKVADSFSVNLALDLFSLTFWERFVGVEILSLSLNQPALEKKLWEILSEMKGQL